MKRLAISFLLLILVSSMAFAERFWCINATENIDASGETEAYRFDYSTVFDLSTYFNGTPKIGDYQRAANPNGKLNSTNAIGTVGYTAIESNQQITTYSGSGSSEIKTVTTYSNHKITYTISTTGKFVSQSDPSKYREFYVVIVPDYATSAGSTSRTFYYSVNNTAPSTKTSNPLTFTDNNSYYSIGVDMFLCMDNPENERTHLSANDDYVATITVTWTCKCTENVKTYKKKNGTWKESTNNTNYNVTCPIHSGSFNMMVRGYYGTNPTAEEKKDTFLLVVNPTQESRNLNLKDMVVYDQTKQIAGLTISTTTREEFDWRSHVHAFLSASSDYATADSNGFRLVNTGNRSISIPYKLTIYNTTSGTRDNGKIYDGTAYYNSATISQVQLDLKDYSKSSSDNYYSVFTDLYGDTYYAINYNGEVDLTLVDFPVPGTDGVQFFTIMRNQNDYLVPYSKYIGKYESNIYYHIVYTDTPVN